MFKNIEKVLDGQYGIGDRTPRAILPSQADLHEEISASDETQEIKDFRTLCLRTVGTAKYICHFKKIVVEFREEGEIALIAAHKFGADFLEKDCYSYLRLILQESRGDSKSISILAPGETRGRVIERERKGDATPSLPPISTARQLNPAELSRDETNSKDEKLPETSLETSMLREKLRNTIPPQQFPSWLGSIEVEGIGQDGTIVVTFDDQLTADYARKRFFQEILQSATKLWGYIADLVIQGEPDNLLSHKRTGNLEIDEETLIELAIKSLMGSSLAGQGGTILNDAIPYKGRGFPI